MADELEKKGHAAFVDEDYDEAVSLYTDGIVLEPYNASLYISRAAAHTKLENFTDAVADANKAIELNPNLPKGYLRKGIACFSLEEYQTAKVAFLAGSKLEPNNAGFKTWIRKCDAELSEEDNLAGKDAGAVSAPDTSHEQAQMETVAESPPAAVKHESVELAPVAPLPPGPPKFKHEWYQTASHVVVGIFAKGIKAENLQVDFGEQILSVVINTGHEEPYALQLRLFGKGWGVAKRMEELVEVLEEWMLPIGGDSTTMQTYFVEYQSGDKACQEPVESKATKYPTSSKTPAKDWDKLEAEAKKEEKDEKLEGDAALNKLFREIYQNADEDTRRAMNKSFVESNGTVLSTNWKEVGTKKIEGSAPSGMEMKKWEL